MSVAISSRVHAITVVPQNQEIIIVKGLLYLGELDVPECVIEPGGPIENPVPCVNKYDFKNPCLRSDNGIYIWGLECWWGSAEKIDAILKPFVGQRIISFSAEQFRVFLNTHVYHS